jgi:hypothetical protein
MKFHIEEEALREFEEGLDTKYPERSKIPAKIIGLGEISGTFLIESEKLKSFAFKRLPIFSSNEEVEEYEKILKEYIGILRNDVGIRVVDTEGIKINTSDGRIVYYIIQKAYPQSKVGNIYIKTICKEKEKVKMLLNSVFSELKKVKDFNEKSENVKVGFDGQISNWIVETDETSKNINLLYLDVSTPLYRKNGKEMLKADLFLKSVPPVINRIVKYLFLQEILDRYYDFRLILIDLIGNFFKEEVSELIPEAIDIANNFLERKIEFEDVKSYYRRDAFIWSLFQFLRRTHRFLKTNILRKRYEFLLPGKIKR